MQKVKSQKILQKLQRVIPGGVNSPARAARGMGIDPLIVDHGLGDSLYDADGCSYIDLCCSWGAMIHGHAHSEILRSIKQALEKGTTFGISTELEEQLAGKVIKLISSIEKVRFVSSGTEATMSAARLARGFTGRSKIVKFDGCYHGHADFFLVKAGSGLFALNNRSSSAGVPESVVQDTVSLPYNDCESVRAFLKKNQVAAVIVEPVAANMGVVPPKPDFLKTLREETAKQGALLIFDEVITGFRVSLGGAQTLYGIQPDLTCLGKIIGGGLPVGAFGGRTEIMDCLAPQGMVYQAGTNSGNPLTMAGGICALRLLERDDFYTELEKKTRRLTDPIAGFLLVNNVPVALQRVGSMFTLFFGRRGMENREDGLQLDTERFSQFFRYMLEHGVYIPPSQYEACFISQAHTEEHLLKIGDLILRFLKDFG